MLFRSIENNDNDNDNNNNIDDNDDANCSKENVYGDDNLSYFKTTNYCL